MIASYVLLKKGKLPNIFIALQGGRLNFIAMQFKIDVTNYKKTVLYSVFK